MKAGDEGLAVGEELAWASIVAIVFPSDDEESGGRRSNRM